METANQLLRDWRDINRARGGRAAAAAAARVPQPHSRTSAQVPPAHLDASLSKDVESKLHVSAGSSDLGPDPFARRNPVRDDSRFHQTPQSALPRPPPGARDPALPAFPGKDILPRDGDLAYGHSTAEQVTVSKHTPRW